MESEDKRFLSIVKQGSTQELLTTIQATKDAKKRTVAVNVKDEFKKSPLHICAMEDFFDKAQMLIQNGADVNSQDKNDWTPLHCAASAGHLKIVRLLLDSGALVASKSDTGAVPLHYLVRNFVQGEDKELLGQLADLMLARGADVNCENAQGETPLHHAAFRGRIPMMSFLLDHGSDINRRSKHGETPLHFACKAGKQEAVKLLISRGANLNIVGEYGSCRDLAIAAAQFDVLSLLNDLANMITFDVSLSEFSAIDLPKKEPFFVCKFGEKEFKSEIIKKDNNPKWKFAQRFEYNARTLEDLRARRMVLEIWEHRTHLADEFVGACAIDLYSLAIGPVNYELSLLD